MSTVGVVPRIRALAAELPGVSLALSLHAPNQALRARIVPSARAYPLERLMAAVAEYQAASGQRVRSCWKESLGLAGRLPAGPAYPQTGPYSRRTVVALAQLRLCRRCCCHGTPLLVHGKHSLHALLGTDPP